MAQPSPFNSRLATGLVARGSDGSTPPAAGPRLQPRHLPPQSVRDAQLPAVGSPPTAQALPGGSSASRRSRVALAPAQAGEEPSVTSPAVVGSLTPLLLRGDGGGGGRQLTTRFAAAAVLQRQQQQRGVAARQEVEEEEGDVGDTATSAPRAARTPQLSASSAAASALSLPSSTFRQQVARLRLAQRAGSALQVQQRQQLDGAPPAASLLEEWPAAREHDGAADAPTGSEDAAPADDGVGRGQQQQQLWSPMVAMAAPGAALGLLQTTARESSRGAAAAAAPATPVHTRGGQQSEPRLQTPTSHANARTTHAQLRHELQALVPELMLTAAYSPAPAPAAAPRPSAGAAGREALEGMLELLRQLQSAGQVLVAEQHASGQQPRRESGSSAPPLLLQQQQRPSRASAAQQAALGKLKQLHALQRQAEAMLAA